MKPGVRSAALALAIVALAAVYRLPDLADRPMHTDEAVNAVIVETLRSQADFVYDPVEHHGPTLPYFALTLLRLAGVDSFATMTETQLRGVTALFGIALVALLFALGPLIGSRGRFAAMLLAALSPAAVYYSRYYIHEMLLVAFTLLAIVGVGRGLHTRRRLPRLAWWTAGGLGLGLMHATKETCVIAYVGMGVGTIAALREDGGWWRPDDRRTLWRIVGGSAVLMSVICFSFFGTDLRGPLDSVLSFETYLRRAGGSDTVHVQPWWYYFTLLGYTELGPFRWSEAAIFVFGGLGLVAVWRGAIEPRLLTYETLPTDADPRFCRFMAAYTVTVTAIYVAIPYKTPWCVLEFWVPWMVVAGIAIGSLGSAEGWGRRRVVAIASTLLFLASLVHLGRQAYLVSFPLAGSYRNPYVYALPLRDVVQLANYVRKLVPLHELGARTPVLVYTDHPWPLPWYLRDLDRVGYWDSATPTIETLRTAAPPLVIASEAEAPTVEAALPTPYARNTYGQRPGVRLVLFVHPDLRAKFVANARGQ